MGVMGFDPPLPPLTSVTWCWSCDDVEEPREREAGTGGSAKVMAGCATNGISGLTFDERAALAV